jgi:hypothetical protein
MKSDLAIATLIRSRMTELGLSLGTLSKRLGYKNIAKGIRRIDGLCDGDFEGTKQFLDVLPQALETSADTVKRALDQTVSAPHRQHDGDEQGPPILNPRSPLEPEPVPSKAQPGPMETDHLPGA